MEAFNPKCPTGDKFPRQNVIKKENKKALEGATLDLLS